MTGAEIRQSFLDFFREKQHAIVPSSSLMPDAPNLLFTNAGMNQFVPIFLGQTKAAVEARRAWPTRRNAFAPAGNITISKTSGSTPITTPFSRCWATGASAIISRRKRSNGRGNWWSSAGNFRRSDFTPRFTNPESRASRASSTRKRTITGPRLFREADLDPAIHIVNGNKKDNFWMMGDTGPCGPCSELHVDLTPDGDTRGALVNKDDPRCIEIWNLVFIQFNANADGTFSPLPQRHVDTGMGFERATAIIQGTKNFTDFSGTVSNYETDIFRPIFDELEKLSGKKYESTLPKHGTAGESDQEKIDIAFRVIADHIRALSFAIADGIIPSNEGRGYVLRRILRRAVRYGRTLGFHEPFFFKLVDVVAKTMGDVFPEVRAKADNNQGNYSARRRSI